MSRTFVFEVCSRIKKKGEKVTDKKSSLLQRLGEIPESGVAADFHNYVLRERSGLK